jgi:hypothetical protein
VLTDAINGEYHYYQFVNPVKVIALNDGLQTKNIVKVVRVLPGSQLEPLNNIGRFLSMLRFDSREKVRDLMEKGWK